MVKVHQTGPQQRPAGNLLGKGSNNTRARHLLKHCHPPKSGVACSSLSSNYGPSGVACSSLSSNYGLSAFNDQACTNLPFSQVNGPTERPGSSDGPPTTG